MDSLEKLKKAYGFRTKDKLVILCISFGSSQIPDRELIPSFDNKNGIRILKKIKHDAENNISWLRTIDGFLLLKNQPTLYEFIKAFIPKNYKKEGLYWGYPKCCVSAFENELKNWERGLFKREELLKSCREIKASSIFGWIPCTNNCLKTRKIGKEIISLCKKYGFSELLNKHINDYFKNFMLDISSLIISRFVSGKSEIIKDYEIGFAKRMIKRFGASETIKRTIKWSEEFLNSKNKKVRADFKNGVKEELKKELKAKLNQKFGFKNPSSLINYLESICLEEK